MKFKFLIKHLGMEILLVFFLITIACKKTSDDPTDSSGFRVISEEFYRNGDQSMKLTFKYSGNRISNWEYDWGEGMNFTYPDKNTISYETYGEENGNSSGKFILSGEKVSEIIVNGESKATFIYNSDGKVISIKYYDYSNGSWILYGEDTFTYSTSNLMQIYCSIPGDRDDKYVFSYNGTELNNYIHSYRENGGDWIENSKDEYIYLAGKVSRINIYHKSNDSWVKSDDYMEFNYDSNGNLYEKVEYFSHYLDQTIYKYEDGSGNFRQLFEFFEDGDVEIDWTWQYLIPMPTK